jgi:phosphatidylglycerophosphatase A
MPPRSRLLLITTFGLGYCRPASGTWGSLPPAVFAAIMIYLGHSPADGTDLGMLGWYVPLALMAVLFSLACLRDGDLAEHVFYKKDPGQVVADETAGMALTLLCCPPAAFGKHGLLAVLAAFLLFRILDITKPWPAHGIQKLRGGWGVLMDDLIVGVYAGGLMWGLVALRVL